MRPAALGAVLLLIAGLAGPLGVPARAAVADWTFLVYMDADNNLEDVGVQDFLEMARVGSTSQVNVVVQFDRAVGYNTQYGDWRTVKRFLVQQGMTPLPANNLSDLGELNMADPATLVGFVTWGAANYPARHYFLDLWDHGLGWQGVILDGSTYMTTADLAVALAQIRSVLGRNVDIVGNDACRMTLEIMYELQPYVDYFVGSQKDEPLDGWPYDRLLAPVVANPSMTPIEVGANLAAAYVSSYRDANPPGRYSVTLSLVSSAALPALVRTFADFVSELNASLPLLQTQVIDARASTERYERGGASGGDEFDLSNFAQNVAAATGNTRLDRRAAELEAAIGAAVLVNEVWDNPDPINGVRARNAHGLSIWFPDVPTEPAYPSLALSRDSGWAGFLATYRSGTPSPLPTSAAARTVDTTLPPDGLADRTAGDAPPPRNGSLFVDLTEGATTVASRELLAVAGQRESLDLTPGRPGRYNVTVLYYVGGKLADLVTVPYLSIRARYRFQGSVTDPRGSPIVGATVTLENRTGAVLTAVSGPSGYAIDAVVPDFFVDGDTLTLRASSGGRVASATFVASFRGTSQTANLVLDTSGSPDLNPGILALAAAGFAIAIVLAGIALWQREQIRQLRRRLP